jgi:hypothetical protein
MGKSFEFAGEVSRFVGKGGWFYVSVPKKYKKYLEKKRPAWGMYPILVRVGSTSWNTKLMVKKGGDFFIALKEKLRRKENIEKGKIIKIKCTLLK